MTDMKANSNARRPSAGDVADYTDVYFNKTRAIIERTGEAEVTYAVFMRSSVICALRLAIEWLDYIAAERGLRITIEAPFAEGEMVPAEKPLLYLTGPFSQLVDLETLYLQKIGAACIAATNAYRMATSLPRAGFLAMDARHAAGSDMAEQMAYAASVGSAAAKKEGATGFIGNATNATAHFFGQPVGFGTMPHALVGYAQGTVAAAEMFQQAHGSGNLTVLVDYYGTEIQDALAVARRFPEAEAAGTLSVRIDTHGGRYLEGLDEAASIATIARNCPAALAAIRTRSELKYLAGPGVSAAAAWRLREALDEAGHTKVKIVVSSGFNADKCRVFGLANAPIDMIGSGSFLPSNWADTYATADIISYDGDMRVKVGRESLLERAQPHRPAQAAE